MSPLDQVITLTLFPDHTGQTKREVKMSLRDFATEEFPKAYRKVKGSLPIVKLQTYGSLRTDPGCLRNNENVQRIHGIEIDYDSDGVFASEKKISIKAARRIFADADVAAVIVPSWSHEEDAPAWHALCPTSKALPPSKRQALVARVNGLFCGELDQHASFTLSQASYYGRPKGAPGSEPAFAEGRAIDQCTDLDSRALEKQSKPNGEKVQDDSRSGRHWRQALKSARSGLSFEDHLAGLDDELAEYAAEARGSSTKGEHDWDRAIELLESERRGLTDKFENHEAGRRKRESTLEVFWGDADDGSEEMEPLIEGFLFQKSFAAIYGPYAVGKSFVAMDIGLHVATGKPWCGHEVAQGPVMYVAPEGYHGLKRRRAAWCKRHDVETPRNFALVRGSLDLQRPGATLDMLAEEARKVGAKLIVIDTLNAAFGGEDENNPAAMGKARHELERLRDLSGGTVLVIHHAGKDLSKGLRGSSVLGGALDTILMVKDGRIISEAPAGKQKDIEAAPDIPFVLQPVDLPPDGKGRPVQSAVVMPGSSEKFEDHDGMTPQEKCALRAFERERDRADLLGDDSVAVGHWRTRFYRSAEMKGANPQARKKAFQRARTSLIRSGCIRVEDERVFRS